jgi:glucan phosphoethanolaminetransferase (alkaline phosphatase superfamily)
MIDKPWPITQNDHVEMKPQTVWAMVVIVFILVAGAVTLVALEKDVTVILTIVGLVVVPILSALGVAVYQKLDQVKEASNGSFTKALEASNNNLAKVLEAQQKTQEQLANLAMVLPSLTQAQVKEVNAPAETDVKALEYGDHPTFELPTPR